MINKASSCRIGVGTLALFILVAAVGACSSSPPPHLFTLAPSTGDQVAKFSGIIKLKRVDVPGYLDRPQFVRYNSSYELTVSEFNRWSEELPDMITRTMVDSLASRLPDSRIYAETGAVNIPTADAVIEINITRFEPDPSGKIELSAQWVVHRNGQKVAIRNAQIESVPGSNDTGAQVAAMSDALGQLAQKIASNFAE